MSIRDACPAKSFGEVGRLRPESHGSRAYGRTPGRRRVTIGVQGSNVRVADDDHALVGVSLNVVRTTSDPAGRWAHAPGCRSISICVSDIAEVRAWCSATSNEQRLRMPRGPECTLGCRSFAVVLGFPRLRTYEILCCSGASSSALFEKPRRH